MAVLGLGLRLAPGLQRPLAAPGRRPGRRRAALASVRAGAEPQPEGCEASLREEAAALREQLERAQQELQVRSGAWGRRLSRARAGGGPVRAAHRGRPSRLPASHGL